MPCPTMLPLFERHPNTSVIRIQSIKSCGPSTLSSNITWRYRHLVPNCLKSFFESALNSGPLGGLLQRPELVSISAWLADFLGSSHDFECGGTPSLRRSNTPQQLQHQPDLVDLITSIYLAGYFGSIMPGSASSSERGKAQSISGFFTEPTTATPRQLRALASPDRMIVARGSIGLSALT